MIDFDHPDPLGKEAVDFGRRLTNGQGGWLRLAIMLGVWLVTLGFTARGVISAQERLSDSVAALSTEMKALTTEVGRLASANDKLSEHVSYSDKLQEDTRRRVEKLEDGGKR